MSIVEAKVIGGIGNQMFIAAAAKALATRLNARLCLDLRAYSEKSSRDFELSYFNLDYEVTPHPLENQSVTQKILNRIGKVKTTQGGLPIFKEESFNFDSRFLEISAPVSLQGYFQSWKYFHNIAEDILQMFSFSAENQVLEDIIKSVGRRFISVHVRRGDYLNPLTRQFHGLASDEYFENALSLIKANLSQNLPVVIFTDSKEGLSAKLNQISDYIVYPEPEVHSGIYMGAMSQAKSFVISNSSFSWWAAYLSDSVEKMVIAPRPWIAKSDMSASDLLPNDWVTLGAR